MTNLAVKLFVGANRCGNGNGPGGRPERHSRSAGGTVTLALRLPLDKASVKKGTPAEPVG
jgi:hypothetical protein